MKTWETNLILTSFCVVYVHVQDNEVSMIKLVAMRTVHHTDYDKAEIDSTTSQQ